MKKCKVVLLSLLIIFAVTIPTFAGIYDTQYRENVNNSLVGVWDNASILSDSEEGNLFGKAKEVSLNCDVSVLFLTIDNAQGYSTEVYTDAFFDKLIYESDTVYSGGDSHSGILFAIDMDNRMSYVNTSGDVIQYLSDYDIDNILSSADYYLGDGEYYSAFIAMANKAEAYIINAENGVSNYTDYTTKTKTSFFSRVASMIGPCFLGFLIVGFVGGFRMYKVENKPNAKVSANEYVAADLNVTNRQEIYVRTYETVDRNYYKPKESSSRSSGSHSSHISSSGHSHGGGGHRF